MALVGDTGLRTPYVYQVEVRRPFRSEDMTHFRSHSRLGFDRLTLKLVRDDASRGFTSLTVADPESQYLYRVTHYVSALSPTHSLRATID